MSWDLKEALLHASKNVQSARDQLCDLDAALGDGDHGTSMARSFAAVERELSSTESNEPADLLELVGNTVLNAVGGAMGPLFGSAFLSSSTALRNADPSLSSPERTAAAIAAAANAIQRRGKASVGDKTMVDAIVPAAEAAATAAGQPDATSATVLRAAAEAAAAGTEHTKELIARIGRASRLGERTLGHQDPGATSITLVLESLAASAGAPVGHPVLTLN
ncbi:dihydroxyacetone kinase nucleotide-binding subunit DhaL [Arthrobacter globiformis NBRC 12137]|uniref:Dihydroxyacetone kinase nucleotide-binding subunit DhaL n=1 Tax=Arthrobacter globiformis (strain ATCC 8010 / DSM 20124 / JCM 1332 / NBRC 12137 / NCIMB 8907 / NRRL B-2979 / 168) TaxID=1077972 RepID=H0QPP1_ARTG1|nr:dihydroxyacetone kinase subunit DhaL [Arthrobacter globiformis]GAB14792.1 dihydroxyacetone kinase nucleotide-binding subunit DhaL [Arthrobacter globiformis NBRC 12137]